MPRLSLIILLFTATLFVITFSVFYHFSSRSIEKAARTKAENMLNIFSLEVEKVLHSAEAVPDNLSRIIARGVFTPDSIFNITHEIVRNNPDIYGTAIAFEPYYFKEKGYYFSPYSYKDKDTIRSLQLGNEDYDYFTWEWYRKLKEFEKPYWSEPYYDKGGGQMVMCTYSVPIYDKNREFIGVFTSDISLEWLTDMLDSMKHGNRSYTFLLANDGTYIVHPQQERILNQTIFDVAEETNNPKLKLLGENMLTGKHGMQVLTKGGGKSYVFYAQIPHTQWSMAIVLPDDEVFGDLHRINLMLILIIGLGLLVLFFISSQMIRNFTKLQQTASAKEKIESELKIARDIQMGMLHKRFPPFPERKEVDLYAVLHPAKEIGGDLYDFFLEEDNLYFAIGDVAGYGIPASLFMAVTLRLFRSIAMKTENTDEVMNALNNSIAENNDSNLFVTLFVGKLNLRTGVLKYCNAGHNPPILIAPNGACTRIQTLPNLPVGVMKNYAYTEQTITLPATNGLLLYTDGVTEAENANKELYGVERLLATIIQNSKVSAREIVDNILSDIKLHIKENEHSDDITLLAINYKGEEATRNILSTLTISNKIEELPKITQFTEQIGKQINIPSVLIMNINLALEEAVANVIHYGYKEKGEERREKIPLHIFEGVDAEGGQGSLKSKDNNNLIEVIASLGDNELVLTLIDDGIAFDPTLIEAPNITLSAEERPIGGLGVFLVKKIMDKLEYKRESGKNILIMTKKILT